MYNQAQAIGKEIDLPTTTFAPYGNPTETMSQHQGGIAIISKWPIGRIRNRRLCPGHDYLGDVRVATFATLLIESAELVGEGSQREAHRFRASPDLLKTLPTGVGAVLIAHGEDTPHGASSVFRVRFPRLEMTSYKKSESGG
jgi:hypothetical protein